jgi:hypothetical protein
MPKENKQPISKYSIPGVILVPKDGYYKVRKPGLRAERVRSDPDFHETRLMAKEFSRVSNEAGLIRSTLLSGTGIKQPAWVLTGVLGDALQSDYTNAPGHRNIMHCDLSKLKNFNFNDHVILNQVFKIRTQIIYKCPNGEVTVAIPAFVPADKIIAPPGITHARIFCKTATFNFEQRRAETSFRQTTILPLKSLTVPETKLVMGNTEFGGCVHIVAVGLQWYQHDRKLNKLIPSKLKGPLAVVDIWRS